MRLVVDVENTFKKIIFQDEGKKKVKTDMLPYTGRNELVSVGIKNVDTKETLYKIFYHRELGNTEIDKRAKYFHETNDVLLRAQLVIGHNLKHDLSWLQATSFKLPEGVKYWDTSIAEYVLAKGKFIRMSLKELAEKYDLPRKKTDLTQEYLDQGVGFEAMPMNIVEEYGIGDLNTTEALYFNQLERLAKPENWSLMATIEMMNEFMYVLSVWQANGIKIDLVELERVKQQYLLEKHQLEFLLNKIGKEVMGDTPFSITSGEDKSVILYSRRVRDKSRWAKTFNIGLDSRGKKLRRTKLTPQEFVKAVKELTDVEYRTEVKQCVACQGLGYYTPPLKSGLPGKARRICKSCNKAGVIYHPTTRVAGFRFVPANVKDVGVNGFVTDADKLEYLISQAKSDKAKEFLTALIRLNQVNTYLNTFVEGILRAVDKNSCMLYTNFNQVVTATGRLSSSDPNFQNIPRGKTFPVKKAIISRFPGGKLIEFDYCVAPTTKILNKNLDWVNADTINVGDKLVGFTEKFKTLKDCTLRFSTVENVKRLRKDCVRIVTTHGTVTCSKDHFWVGRKAKKAAKWYSASDLRVGDTISRFTSVWNSATSFDAGWLSGIFDGEGWVTNTSIAVSQKPSGDNNLVSKKIKSLLKDFGFKFTASPNKSGCERIMLKGEQQGLKFCGMFKPVRLIKKIQRNIVGSRTYGKHTKPATILSIEDVGVQDVIAIQTSTRTFIAEGMLSHNCQLEFRCAGALSGDKQIYEDIVNKVDIHAFTRDTLNKADGGNRDRQDAKPETFKPVYGGTYGTPVQMAYYAAFKKKYKGLTEWQDATAEYVLKHGYYKLPTGRQYQWRGIGRGWDGRVEYFTQIVNYPVQGFATGDIVPIACISIQKALEKEKLKSVGFLTVHDSVAIDTYPGEEEAVRRIMVSAMLGVREELKRRYEYDLTVPLEVEGKMGTNWLELNKMCVESHKVINPNDIVEDTLDGINWG